MTDLERFGDVHELRRRGPADQELGELLADVRRLVDGCEAMRLVFERTARTRGPALDEMTAYGVRVLLERLSVQLAAAERAGSPAVGIPRADVHRLVAFLASWVGDA